MPRARDRDVQQVLAIIEKTERTAPRHDAAEQHDAALATLKAMDSSERDALAGEARRCVLDVGQLHAVIDRYAVPLKLLPQLLELAAIRRDHCDVVRVGAAREQCLK